MKKIPLLTIVLLFFTLPILAQKTNYLSECGGQQATIVWQENRTNGKIHLDVTQGDERHEYVMNKSFQTEKWKVVNLPSQTDLTIELHNGTYSIAGKLKFGMVQGKLLFMKYYPQVWRFLKNNLNSNRHGYTFDNVPISFRENFSLV